MKPNNSKKIEQVVKDFIGSHPDIVQIIIDLINKYPELSPIVPDLLRAYSTLIQCFDNDHRLFLCGNGGSFTDSMHMSGELIKAFSRKRNLTADDKKKFENHFYGVELGNALEYGFPTTVLGINHSLFTSIENDIATRYIGFAQELFVLGRKDDVLIAISTSGNAKNVLAAVSVAKVKGMTTIGLTGEIGGLLAKHVDLAIRVPASKTDAVQEFHLPICHALSAIVEAHYFKEPRT
jgi:D-sedoheptulose 7-phosphate isomerase